MEAQEYKDNGCEWVSVSECAKIISKSKQTVYNMIKDGRLEAISFKRQSMNGLLVRIPTNNIK